MKPVLHLIFLSLLISCTYASLLDFLRLERKRRQFDCCSPPAITTCCAAENNAAMMAAPMAAAAAPLSCCAPPAITTCCDTTGAAVAPAAPPTASMDEESRDMFNAWNAPVSLGVFINPEATPDDTGKASKRTETPFHQSEGSGSGSGGSFFASDSAKRDEVPKPVEDKKPEEKKDENVKKSTIETVPTSTKNIAIQAEKKTTIESNERKSELSAKASKIEEVQGEKNEKRQTTVTCQGQKDWLQCPTYQLIKIKDAFWGRDDEKTCTRSHTERSISANKMCAQDESNTMAKLQNACDGESACELVASPVYFDRTDCPDVYKFLRVDWECDHSESRIKSK